MLAVSMALLAGACDLKRAAVLDPKGPIALAERDLLFDAFCVMMIVIVPVIILTLWFAWRYRASNTSAQYTPTWSNSVKIDAFVWSIPAIIVISLGVLLWRSTYKLDPYRPIENAGPAIEVQVVAQDWKWLFIYPEQGVATVNELAVPAHRPLRFRISASSVMNSFYVPALAGQIYAMPGMETKLHGVFNETGNFTGFSANYSGAGFSNMRFAVKSLPPAAFDRWVAQTKASEGGTLDRLTYLRLERPSEKEPVRRFAAVETQLFDAVVNMCVEPGKMCMHDMMSIDAKGGAGIAGIHNVRDIAYDKFAARGSTDIARWSLRYVAALCSSPLMRGERPDATPVNPERLKGEGLPVPGDGPGRTALNAPATRPMS